MIFGLAVPISEAVHYMYLQQIDSLSIKNHEISSPLRGRAREGG